MLPEKVSRSDSPETAEKSAKNNKCLAALLFWNVAREIQTVIGGLNSKAVCSSYISTTLRTLQDKISEMIEARSQFV